MADMFLIRTKDEEPRKMRGIFHNADHMISTLRANYPELRGKRIRYGISDLSCDESTVYQWTEVNI